MRIGRHAGCRLSSSALQVVFFGCIDQTHYCEPEAVQGPLRIYAVFGIARYQYYPTRVLILTNVVTTLDNLAGGIELCSLKSDKMSGHWEGRQ